MAPCSPFLYSITSSVIFLITLTMEFSNGTTDVNDTACSSLCSCGSIKDVGYPFWEGKVRPAFCGLLDFRLKCTNDSVYPWMALNAGHYNIHHIDTSSHTIVVARDKNEICRVLGKEQASINVMPPFELGASVGNITLFYRCKSNLSTFYALSFQCLSHHKIGPVYYFNETTDGRTCKTKVTIPLSKRALDELNRGNAKLDSALEEDFEISYTANFSDCSKCRDSGEKRNGRNLGLILGLGIPGATILTAFVNCWYCQRLKSGQARLVSRSVSLETTTSDLEEGSTCFGVPLFLFRELEEATDNFNESRQLGSGGFGIVFYGILRDGRKVAVKRLYEKSYRRVEQFINEVQILTCLRHQNLVSLYGCTSPRCKELLLVYEYVSNGTVADHLYGNKPKSELLSWPIRLRIAIETATALACLHTSHIIHRDVKTNNILLDSSFGVKVADFGLSRLFPTDVTHVSTAPQGSPGYLDPEYHQCYQLTVKSDVYSFGVVLVELISSLPAVDINRQKHEINLSNYAMKKIQQGLHIELADPKLGFGSDLRVKSMIISMAELAFQCLQHDKEFRPSMDEALEVLKRIENTDYEALEAKEEPKSDKIGGSTKMPSSPTEDDYAGLLISSRNHQQRPIL